MYLPNPYPDRVSQGLLLRSVEVVFEKQNELCDLEGP